MLERRHAKGLVMGLSCQGVIGGSSSPIGTPASRYDGANEAFGDVEEDEGASGNPGTSTLGGAGSNGLDAVCILFTT